MKVIKSEEAEKGKNSELCKTLEYSFQDKDIDVGVATITGRYPESGYCVNLISKELIYVLEGEGKICFENEIVEFKANDSILIEPKDKYYWDTEYCKVTMTCTPAWSPEQHKLISEEISVVEEEKITIEPLFQDFVDFETFSKSDFRAVKIKKCVSVPKSKKLLQFTLDDGTSIERTILSGIHAYYEPEELIGKTVIAILNLPPRNMMGIDSCGMLLSAIHEINGEERLNLLIVDDKIPAGAKLY